jgi:predicted RNA-binding Zn-ribbon protein involved in translation (DUF1610 family)
MNEDLFGGITGGMTFDSSLSETLDKSLSPDEYKGRILNHLGLLLAKRFPGHPGKQNPRPHTDRITFACPYCGDSMQSDYKIRGNIILSGKFAGHYKCFNCGMFKTVDAFFRDWEVDLQLDFVNYLSSTKGDFKKSSYGSYDISILMDSETIEGFAIEREELKKRFSLVEIAESSRLSWLRNRLQFDEERFLYNVQYDYVVILNLTKSGKILGFQRRNFDRRLEKYNTYNLRRIYQEFGWDKEIPDDIDVLSQIYRISEVDFNRPITLFEGPLDSFLLNNSVANAGLNKGFPIDIPLRYWVDDDQEGRKKSVKLIGAGEYVFLWDKFKRDFGLPYRKKWDLTDVMVWFRDKKIRPPIWDQYFSNDPLDSIDI